MDSKLNFNHQITNIAMKIKHKLKGWVYPLFTFSWLDKYNGGYTGLSKKTSNQQPDSWGYTIYSD